jgi:hypothetical protein
MSAIHESHHEHPTIRERVVEEIRRFLWMFFYLWVVLGIFVLSEQITLRQHGLRFTALGFAFINALILAKVMLLAEDLKLGQRQLRNCPLFVRIVFESFIFVVVFIVFHVIEEVVVGMVAGKTAAESVPAIGGGGVVGLVSVAILYFLAMLPYFGFRNLERALEPGKLRGLLFGPPPQTIP